MSHRKYLLINLSCCLLAFLSAALLNTAVDPHNYFGTPEALGFNEIKPRAPTHVRSSKPYQVARISPRTLVGGNSRPEIGLDPSSPCWQASRWPVFNYGIPGAGIYMQTRVLQDAALMGGVDYIMLGVDFTDFLVDVNSLTDFGKWPEKPADFEKRLSRRADGSKNSMRVATKLQDWALGAFSLDATLDSIITLASQNYEFSDDSRRDGFHPGMKYLAIIKSEGQSVLFDQKNREMANRLSNPDTGLFENNSDWSTSFEALKRFLEFSKSTAIEVTLFINPIHAEYLASIYLSGRWDAFENWKRTLVELSESYKNVQIWDFSGFDIYSTEPPPDSGDKRSVLEWFWEPAHYRQELGDLMIGRMLGVSCGNSQASWGTKITGENIGDHNAQSRAQLMSYIDKEDSGFERLRALFSGVQQSQKKRP